MPWEKQFDRDEVLGNAMRAFWMGGYETTSMEKLLDAMGIQKGSFYATFGSKRDVLLEALQRYVSDWLREIKEEARRKAPIEALEKHFQTIYESTYGAKRHWGCFLMNSGTELASRDKEVARLVHKTFAAQTGFYRELLLAAQREGAIQKSFDCGRAAQVLFGLVLGMRVLAKAGMPRESIRPLYEHALAVVRGEL